MPTKRKDQPEVRTDASGRELFPWEVDPADQVSRRAAAEDAAPVAGGVQVDTGGEGGGDR
jgi:hypothetical protein